MNTRKQSASITKLERYGKAGWQWLVDGKPMRTNSEGEGLWSIGSYEGQWASNYEDRQTAGTMQFSLPSNNKNAARSKLYREFYEEVLDN